MKENAGFLTSWLKQIFLIHAHDQLKRASDNT